MSIFSRWFSNKESESSTFVEPKKPQFSALDYCEQGQRSLDAGKYVEAMEFFQAAIEVDRRFEKAYLLLSEAYEKQGNMDKAKSALYGLLAIDPNNEQGLEKLAGLMQTDNRGQKKKSKTIQKYEKQSDSQLCDNIGSQNTSVGSNISCQVGTVVFEMVFVEGGKFYCGAQSQNRYKPNYDPEAHYFDYAREEKVSDFYIGKYLVTQQLWEVIMGDNPASNNKGGDYPIESVTAGEMHEFIHRLNDTTGLKFRLPTDVEWEYAARGGKKSNGYKYPGSNDLSDVAWIYGMGTSTHKVGEKVPNELGLYDMMGNVMELCDKQNEYSLEHYFYILKGGANHRTIDWYAHELDRRRRLEYITLGKIYSWSAALTNHRDYDIGMRLAMDK